MTQVNYKGKREEVLVATDSWMPRVLEDLLVILVEKGTLSLSDLPSDSRRKVEQRLKTRGE